MTEFSNTPVEARKLWVDALRSGYYKQGKDFLCTVNVQTEEHSYCCLGVACELFMYHESAGALLSRNAEDTDITEEKSAIAIRYDDTAEVAPNIVKEWLGLKNQVGGYSDENGVDTLSKSGIKLSLATLNDKGYTFEAIADIIESPEFLASGTAEFIS